MKNYFEKELYQKFGEQFKELKSVYKDDCPEGHLTNIIMNQRHTKNIELYFEKIGLKFDPENETHICFSRHLKEDFYNIAFTAIRLSYFYAFFKNEPKEYISKNIEY